jgi:hypothetical protein
MKKLLVLSSVALIATSCVAPAKTGMSLISNLTEPVLVSSNIKGSKEGRACAENYVGIYAHGDMSIAAAAKNGGITKISSIDQVIENRILFNKVCTIVRGE